MLPALAWARVHISQVPPLHSQASLHQQIVLQWPSWEQMYWLCSTWLADSPRRREGEGKQPTLLIYSIHPASSASCRSQSRQLVDLEMEQHLPIWWSRPHCHMFHKHRPTASAQDRALAFSSPPAIAGVPSQKPSSSWLERRGRNVTGEGGEIRHNPERVENYLESTWLFSSTSSSLVLEATQLSNANFRHPWASKATFSTLK